MPLSLAPKPEPVTVTEVPGGPLVRLRVRAPPSTEKVTVTVPEVAPVAPILWEPAVAAGIVTVAFQFPDESAVAVVSVVLSKVIVIASLLRKPEPVTVTEVPGGPLVRLRVTVVLTTVKVAVAEPEDVPVAVIVRAPAVADDGIVTVAVQLAAVILGRVANVTAGESKVIVTFSPTVKPVPVTVTEVLTGPLDGLTVIVPAA